MVGQPVLVCGASQGIGEATARYFASEGHPVTLLARSEEKLSAIAASLPGQGHKVLKADLMDAGSWEPQLAELQKSRPHAILILNSGGPKGGPISQAQPEEFLKAMELHLVGNSRLVRACLENMKTEKFGRIITVTSTSVKVPIPHLGVSNTVRAAVASWGKTLSLELAPFGITVNNVMPGFTNTPRLESLIQVQANKLGKSIEDVTSDWKAKVPMGRFAEPAETAALIGFLASVPAGYITGQNIAVDGGRLGCL
jgi:3-oxoacyl-[acyl-carrier protein] reductase